MKLVKYEESYKKSTQTDVPNENYESVPFKLNKVCIKYRLSHIVGGNGTNVRNKSPTIFLTFEADLADVVKEQVAATLGGEREQCPEPSRTNKQFLTLNHK